MDETLPNNVMLLLIVIISPEVQKTVTINNKACLKHYGYFTIEATLMPKVFYDWTIIALFFMTHNYILNVIIENTNCGIL